MSYSVLRTLDCGLCTHMSDSSEYADVIPIHTLTTGCDRRQGVTVLHRSERGVSQGGQLVVIWSRVEGDSGIGLADIDLVRTGCPSVPPLLSFAARFAENLPVHYLNYSKQRT